MPPATTLKLLLAVTHVLLFHAACAVAETPQPEALSEAQQIQALPGEKENQALLAEYAEVVKKMRADMGLPADVLPDPAASPDSNQSDQDPLSRIKIRVITGKEGVPFPSPEKVVLEPTPTPQVLPTETPLPTATPWRPPGRCSIPKTNTVVINKEERGNTILSDKLFLPEDLLPLDEGEVYGVGVQLYPYGPNQGEGQYLVQEMYLVPCVPYRIRQTLWGYYEHRGDDALKHYDNSGNSNGKYHAWVQQKLFGAAKRAPHRNR